VEDVDTSQVSISPTFEDICIGFHEMIDIMVASVQSLPRVENSLFQEVENLEIPPLSSMHADEVVPVLAKQHISNVILNNSAGPQR